jgi:ribosomal protein L40E
MQHFWVGYCAFVLVFITLAAGLELHIYICCVCLVSCVFIRSLFLTKNALAAVIFMCRVVISFSSYITENTICLNCYFDLPGSTSASAHLSQRMQSYFNCYFDLSGSSSALAHTSHRTECLSCYFDSLGSWSVPAYTSQRTQCISAVTVIQQYFSFSSYITENTICLNCYFDLPGSTSAHTSQRMQSVSTATLIHQVVKQL